MKPTDIVEKYIRENSNGKDTPVCSSEIAKAFGVPRTSVRHMINSARSNGSPICSCQKGYYIATDKVEIQETIDSMRGRIAKMEKAISGLELCLSN